ncbi:hypothetical protein NVP1170O_105 [Vibrio phage 1.170.O._10N.261.52.C3]|nr:hypothetical protein NVP1170O_105 [Vibrio phage 1.170.O._10N.261.52.C3]
MQGTNNTQKIQRPHKTAIKESGEFQPKLKRSKGRHNRTNRELKRQMWEL